MKKIRYIVVSCLMVLGIGATVLPTTPVAAINVFNQCAGNPDTAICRSQGDNARSMVKDVINVLLYILGIIAVIMIIIGGLRYTVSGGDASSTKSAKDTILYSVIGLVVAIMAYAIVNFVVGKF